MQKSDFYLPAFALIESSCLLDTFGSLASLLERFVPRGTLPNPNICASLSAHPQSIQMMPNLGFVLEEVLRLDPNFVASLIEDEADDFVYGAYSFQFWNHRPAQQKLLPHRSHD